MKVIEEAAINRSRLRFKRMRDYAEAIVQTVREPLVVLDAKLRIKSVNQAFCKMFDVSVLNTKNKLIYKIKDTEWKFHRLQPLLNELLSQNSPTPHCEVNSYFTGKGHKTMLLNARRIEGVGISESLVLLAIEDVTERKQTQQALEKLLESVKQDALTDPLTGLYNLRGFLTMGAQFLKIGHRMGKGIFVLFIDVDGLKQTNDQNGHAEGDKVIVRTSNILKKTFRQADVVARIGGDEFAVITIEQLPGSITTVMSRLKRHSAQVNGDVPVSLSVGVAQSNSTDMSTIEELIAKADADMYIQKQHKHLEGSLHRGLPDGGNSTLS